MMKKRLPITPEEWLTDGDVNEAFDLAEKVLNWVKDKITVKCINFFSLEINRLT